MSYLVFTFLEASELTASKLFNTVLLLFAHIFFHTLPIIFMGLDFFLSCPLAILDVYQIQEVQQSYKGRLLSGGVGTPLITPLVYNVLRHSSRGLIYTN